MDEDVVAAAIDVARGDDMAALPHQGDDSEMQGCLARAGADRADTAFQRCQPLLKNRPRGIGDARVADRTSVVEGKRVCVSVDRGGRRKLQKKKYDYTIVI